MVDTEERLGNFRVNGVFIEVIKEYDEYDPDQFDGFYVDDSYVELDGPIWKMNIEETDIYIREGTWFEQDETGEWMPDWSLTWFYVDPENPAEYLYFEQDDIQTAVHNFLHMYR